MIRLHRRSKVSLDKSEATIASTAAKDASRRLVATQAQWPEVRAVAAALTEMRLKNHFAEMIRAAIIGE